MTTWLSDQPTIRLISEGNSYLHLPGVIMAQNAAGERVYLLSDGLDSVRQVISGTTVVEQRDFDPYGNPTQNAPRTTPYAFTGEWWQDYIAPDKSYLTPQWAILSKNSNCDDILKCFKRTFDLVESLEFAYGAGVINSNRVVSTALLNCGLPATPRLIMFCSGMVQSRLNSSSEVEALFIVVNKT